MIDLHFADDFAVLRAIKLRFEKRPKNLEQEEVETFKSKFSNLIRLKFFSRTN